MIINLLLTQKMTAMRTSTCVEILTMNYIESRKRCINEKETYMD
jgi:hypothetical protein